MTWCSRIGVFQLTRFKSESWFGINAKYAYFHPLNLVPFLTFSNFFINLGPTYDILSLLSCFSVAKPSWNTSAKLMTMMMMMNSFCGMVDRRKALSLISSRGHCQRFSPLWISNTPRAGFEPAQNLSSSFVEWSCAVVITNVYHNVSFIYSHILWWAIQKRV